MYGIMLLNSELRATEPAEVRYKRPLTHNDNNRNNLNDTVKLRANEANTSVL